MLQLYEDSLWTLQKTQIDRYNCDLKQPLSHPLLGNSTLGAN